MSTCGPYCRFADVLDRLASAEPQFCPQNLEPRFVAWLEQRGVRHIDLWRADLNTLNPVDGTRPWVYSTLAGFLKSDDDYAAAPTYQQLPLLAQVPSLAGAQEKARAAGIVVWPSFSGE